MLHQSWLWIGRRPTFHSFFSTYPSQTMWCSKAKFFSHGRITQINCEKLLRSQKGWPCHSLVFEHMKSTQHPTEPVNQFSFHISTKSAKSLATNPFFIQLRKFQIDSNFRECVFVRLAGVSSIHKQKLKSESNPNQMGKPITAFRCQTILKYIIRSIIVTNGFRFDRAGSTYFCVIHHYLPLAMETSLFRMIRNYSSLLLRIA